MAANIGSVTPIMFSKEKADMQKDWANLLAATEMNPTL